MPKSLSASQTPGGSSRDSISTGSDRNRPNITNPHGTLQMFNVPTEAALTAPGPSEPLGPRDGSQKVKV